MGGRGGVEDAMLGGVTAVGCRDDDIVPWSDDVTRVDAPLGVVDGRLRVVDTAVVVGRRRGGSVAVNDGMRSLERRTSVVVVCGSEVRGVGAVTMTVGMWGAAV